MIAAVYLRKSRSDFQGESIEETLHKHQIALTKFAAENHIAIAKVYPEVVSGDSLYCRPQMMQLLEDVEAGEYDAVLCMDIDRLGRGGMKDQGIILEAFKNSETKIITPDKSYDLNDDMDEELTEFKTFMSRRELKMITKRLQRGLRQTINSGGFLTTAPYGYQKGEVSKIPSLLVKEEEAYFVRIIFKMYAEGNSTYSIADYLNSLGGRTRTGGSFGRSTIRYILCNPIYTGKVVWNRHKHIKKGKIGNDARWKIENPPDKWVVVDGVHEPLVTQELFDQVQKIRSTRSIPSTTKAKHGMVANPFAGLIWCDQCGGRMQRQGPSGKAPYILCPKAGCVAGVKQALLEKAVLESLEKQLHEISIELVQSDAAKTEALERDLSTVRKELEQLNQQQNRLFDLLEQGAYNIETFQKRQISLQDRILQAEAQRGQLETALSKARRENQEILCQKLRDVLSAYQSLDPKHQNLLLKSVVEKIYYYKEKKSGPEDFRLRIILKQF